MKLKNGVKRRAMSLMGSPVMAVEVDNNMLDDIYKYAVNKFKFKNKRFKKIKEQWIENYFQANLKESLSHVRDKFKGELPIPGAGLKLAHKLLLKESQKFNIIAYK